MGNWHRTCNLVIIFLRRSFRNVGKGRTFSGQGADEDVRNLESHKMCTEMNVKRCKDTNSPHVTLMLWFKTPSDQSLPLRPGLSLMATQSHSPELRLAANYNFPHCPKYTSDNLENK